MSTFICGLFEAKNANDIEDLHRLGWMIADEGRRERLYFHLYSAISQQIVFQIVGFSFEKAPLNHLPFLISNSPIWNVSDELLEDQAATITTLTKLHRIFSKLAGHITRIEIYFSEGWDERYERIEVTLDNFEATVLARLAEDPEVPSICVDVRL